MLKDRIKWTKYNKIDRSTIKIIKEAENIIKFE